MISPFGPGLPKETAWHRRPGFAAPRGCPDSRRLGQDVADTGIGMTEVHVSHLLQRFHQADMSSVREFGDTGSGMALSIAFGAMLGGDLTVQSTPRPGSTFTMLPENSETPTLPLASRNP